MISLPRLKMKIKEDQNFGHKINLVAFKKPDEKFRLKIFVLEMHKSKQKDLP